MQRWAQLAAASITARLKPAAQCRMLMLPQATAQAALVTAQPVTRRMDVRMDARMNTRMNARMIARMALAPRKDARMNARMDARIACGCSQCLTPHSEGCAMCPLDPA